MRHKLPGADAATCEAPEARQNGAQALLELDHVWQAVQCAGRAAELAPAWPDGHLTLGRAQLELGEVSAIPCHGLNLRSNQKKAL